ncbi:MAG: HDOD domain-containing protein [Candidatus Gracilibacteria bacterium]|nr:HDOD domain-containing protein [Candidatus Gracilibacteria bacterium]
MKQILDKIEIPSLPTSIIKIEAILNSSDFEVSKMAAIINEDQGLISYVLKSANSPLYGFKNEINSVHRAIALFGKSLIKAWVYQTIMKAVFDKNISAYEIDTEILSELSKKQTAFAIQWANIEFPDFKDKIGFFAFMMELGKIPFSILLKTNNKDIEFFSKFKEAKQSEIAIIEKEFADITSYEFSYLLFEKWNMDNELVNVMKFIDCPEIAEEELSLKFDNQKLAKQLGKIAKVLHIVKNIFSLKILSDEELNDILVKAESFGFNRKNIMQVLNKITASEGGCFLLSRK